MNYSPHHLRLFLVAPLVFSALSISVWAGDGTWNSAVNANWNAPGSWVASTIADGSGSTATFDQLTVLATPLTVTLGADRTIGNLVFGSTPGNQSWIISGSTVTLAGGTPTVNVGNLGTGTVTITSGLNLSNNGLTKSGSGTLVIGGSAITTAAGNGIHIVAGTLQLGGTTLNARADLIFTVDSTGIFELNGQQLDPTRNRTLNGSGVVKNTLANQSVAFSSGNFYGNVQEGYLYLRGDGVTAQTLTLSGTNTYTGVTTIYSSLNTLIVTGSTANSSSYGVSGKLQVGNNTTTGNIGGGNVALASAGSTLEFKRSNDLTINNAISGAGRVIQSGAGTTTLTTALNHTGLTDVQAGTLRLGVASGFRVNAPVQVSGGTLDLQNFNSSSQGTITLLSGQITSTTGVLSSNVTFGGFDLRSGTVDAILGGTAPLNKTTTGTVTLSRANTYTGVTTVSEGTLSASVLANGGSNSSIGASANAASNLILNGGTLQYTGGAVSTNRLFSVGTSGGTLDASGSGAVNFTNTGSLDFNSQTGTRTLTLTGNNIGNNTIAAILANDGSSNATSLVKNGAGKWILSGANTYTGGTTISNGTLALGSSDRLADTGAVTVSGGTLDLATFSDTVGAVTISSGTISNGTLTGTSYSATNSGTVSAVLAGSGVALTKSGAGTLTLTNNNPYSGNTTLSAGKLEAGNNGALGTGTLVLNGGTLSSDSTTGRTFANAVTLGGDVTLGDTTNDGALTFNGAGTLTGNRTVTTASAVTYAGAMGGGANGLTKAGDGSLTFTAANTYMGDTIVSGGTLILSGSGSVASNVIQVQSGATLSATGGYQLQSGQTLQNKGTFEGNLTALSGSTYAPGNSPGIATQDGNLALNTGSNFQWELIGNTSNDAGINFDQTVFASGGLTIQTGVTADLSFIYPGSTVDWTNAFWSSNQQWLVFTGANSLSTVPGIFTTINVGLDSLSQSLEVVRAGSSFSFTSVGNDVYLNYTLGVIPEPSTTLLLTAGLMALVLFRRRARS